MANQNIHTKGLCQLFGLLDGNFPSGSFVHSFGLEPHILQGKVTNIITLEQFLKNLITHNYTNFEFVVMKKVYEFLSKNDITSLTRFDNSLGAYQSFEFAKASKDIGASYFSHIKTLPICKEVSEYYKEARAKNELVVLSAFAYSLGVNLEIFLALWCRKSITNISLTALKISRIKPSSIQAMLFDLDEFISKIELDSIPKTPTNFNPLFEEVIFSHKNLSPKMFKT